MSAPLWLRAEVFLSPLQLLVIVGEKPTVNKWSSGASDSSSLAAVTLTPWIHRSVSTFPQSVRFCNALLGRRRQLYPYQRGRHFFWQPSASIFPGGLLKGYVFLLDDSGIAEMTRINFGGPTIYFLTSRCNSNTREKVHTIKTRLFILLLIAIWSIWLDFCSRSAEI